MGLNATERDFAVMYPSSLFSKPVLCVQDYVQAISVYASKTTDLTVYPAFTDSDIMRPFLLSKVISNF